MTTKNDVVVKLVLVFFISLLSFSIGTFVGKKYSDNQHQIAQLEPKKSEKTNREVSSVHGNEEPKSVTMSDEEIAKLAEEFVSDETKPPIESETAEGHGKEGTVKEGTSKEGQVVEEHGHKREVAEAPSEEHKVEHSATHAPVHSQGPSQIHVDEKEMPAEKSAPTTAKAKTPTSLPKEVGPYTAGKFTVQVASYADEAEAQKTASELKEKGYSAFYVPASIKGKTWYRVSVGQFATVKEATTYRTDLITKEKVNTAIVQKIAE